jgi:hypothetical protein
VAYCGLLPNAYEQNLPERTLVGLDTISVSCFDSSLVEAPSILASTYVGMRQGSGKLRTAWLAGVGYPVDGVGDV